MSLPDNVSETFILDTLESPIATPAPSPQKKPETQLWTKTAKVTTFGASVVAGNLASAIHEI